MLDFNKELKNRIIGGLRRVFASSWMNKECRENARHPTERGKRGGAKYVCAGCGQL